MQTAQSPDTRALLGWTSKLESAASQGCCTIDRKIPDQYCHFDILRFIIVPKKWIISDFAKNAALKPAQASCDGPTRLEAVSRHRATRGTRWDRSPIAHFVSVTESSHPQNSGS